MANLFVNLPVPAANGSGAPVNMAAFGISKTISVAGPFLAAVTIEVSNELVPTRWAPLITFNNPDGIVLEVACRWMRASVAGFRGGTPACDVGGSDDGTLFASLPAPPSNGAGAAVDVSGLPLFKTVTVGGPFSGTVQIEVSEDGITAWSQLGFGFANPGQQSLKLTARFMRVVRAGLSIAGGLPIVDVAACNDGSDAPSGVSPKLYTVYVGKNGVDVTADGSIGKPFLTVQAAMEFAWTTYVAPLGPQPVPPFRRPCVFVNAGTYDDGDLVLPPQICVMGEGFNHSRINGNWTIDARWTSVPASGDDMRSSWINVGLFGQINIDFETVLSNEGKLYALGCRFAAPVTINQKTTNPSSNSFNIQACEVIADMTLGAIPAFIQNSTFLSTLILNQLIGGGVDNKFASLGSSFADIIVNASSGAAPPYDCAFSHSVQPAATLTLNGTFSTVRGTFASIPLQSQVILAGGANLNQITRINQLNWSGITANRPPAPYVGQQYFDTTIVPNRPIWWNGLVWIDATGAGV